MEEDNKTINKSICYNAVGGLKIDSPVVRAEKVDAANVLIFMMAGSRCWYRRLVKRPASERNRENFARRNLMRKVIEPQKVVGETDIGATVLDPKSRDDTPQILRGLQCIYTEPSLREPVFAILEEVLPERVGSESNASPTTRRPGMDQINQEAVREGHRALKGSLEEGLRERCGSFVMEADVHFPTDINLLRDAFRKTLQTCARLSETHGLTEWRQSAQHICQFKKRFRKIQKLKHSISKDERKRQVKEKAIREAHRIYLEQAEGYLRRARRARQHRKTDCGVPAVLLAELDGYITETVLEL